VDGEAAFQVTGCSQDESYSQPGGDEVDVDVLGTWLMLIDPVLKDGHSWSYGGYTTYTWKRETSVTVPAGTYTDCWTAVSSVSTFPTSTYCRGIGPVHVTSDSSDQQLTATSF
jgi:hypothetical protein